MGSLTEVVLAAFARMEISTLAVMVGDSDAPAVFRMPIDGSVPLLNEVARQEATVVLATESADGILVLDLPNPDQSVGDALVSGTGTLDSIPGELLAAFPGGAAIDFLLSGF